MIKVIKKIYGFIVILTLSFYLSTFTLNARISLKCIKIIGGTGSGEGLFFNPQNMCLDDNGNIYVLDSANQRIEIFDKNGILKNIVRNNILGSVTGIATDIYAIYTINDDTGEIIKFFGSDFSLMESIKIDDINITGGKYDLFIGNNNRYICSIDDDYIYICDFDWSFSYRIGGFGKGLNFFSKPISIWENNDFLYVAEYNNSRIQILNMENEKSELINLKFKPISVCNANIGRENIIFIGGRNKIYGFYKKKLKKIFFKYKVKNPAEIWYYSENKHVYILDKQINKIFICKIREN